MGLGNAAAWPGDHRLIIDVVAEGFQRTWTFTVEVLAPGEFMKRFPDRTEQVPRDIRGWGRPEGW